MIKILERKSSAILLLFAFIMAVMATIGGSSLAAFDDVGIPKPAPKPSIKKDIMLRTGDAQSVSNLVPVPVRKPLSHGHHGLSEKDALLYKEIFSLQREGLWDQADESIASLDDLLLRGHVLYQRYMHPAKYKARYEELAQWMTLYYDHPDAQKIYKLAVARAPASKRDEIHRPKPFVTLRGTHSELLALQSYKSSDYIAPDKSRHEKRQTQHIITEVNKLLKRGAPTRALNFMNLSNHRALLNDSEYASLLGKIAFSYMHAGLWDKAKTYAAQAVRMAPGQTALGGWVAGMTHWRSGDYIAAAVFFEHASLERTSPWMRSAGAYWAARAHMRSGNFQEVTPWLEKAAEHQRTFYGMIATHALGRSFDFDWSLPDYTPKMQRALKSYPGALRALALVQADQHHLAEEELRHIHPGQSDQLKDALLAFAADSRLPAYQMRFASLFKNARGSFYDAALYPIAPWKAEEENADQNIDDAVLNAFIRQESRFRSGAHNPSGATGLMQIMPDTANYVMGTRRYSGAGAERLKDPALNMKIGERYIHSLLQMDAVNYNLFYLAVAYNAGPGNLRKWRREQGDVQDPLFFIETIPVAETRAFVERVMHNLWVYRLRMGQPVTSLDYVASGEWPSYIAMDGGTHHVASMRPKHTGIPQ